MFAIQRGSNGLRTSGDRPKHQHLADTIETEKELGQQRIESGAAFLYRPIGHCVSRPFRGGHASKPQLAQIARKRGLGNVPAALEQEFAEILLTADGPGVDDLEDRVVPFALVGHCG